MNKTLRLIGAVILLAMPMVSLASIDQNLQYGSRGPKVTELQEFLIDQSYLTGSATGNFYALTLKAVKAFQAAHNISSTGYVGVLTRAEINSELATSLSNSVNDQVTETGTTTADTTTEAYRNAQAQSALMSAQLQAQLDAQARLDAINQSVKDLQKTVIAVTTPPPPPQVNKQMTLELNADGKALTDKDDFNVCVKYTEDGNLVGIPAEVSVPPLSIGKYGMPSTPINTISYYCYFYDQWKVGTYSLSFKIGDVSKAISFEVYPSVSSQ